MSERNPPSWITENIPQELVESTLFRFSVELQTVRAYVCEDCNAEYSNRVKYCNKLNEDSVECGCDRLKKEHKKVVIDLLPDLDLDYEILEETMQDIPSQFAFYSMVYSEARMKVAIEERRLKAVRGAITRRIQSEAADSNIKLTADQVKNVIEASDDIVKADFRLQLAQMQCGKLWSIVEALRIKTELARSLAGFKRQERDNS